MHRHVRFLLVFLLLAASTAAAGRAHAAQIPQGRAAEPTPSARPARSAARSLAPGAVSEELLRVLQRNSGDLTAGDIVVLPQRELLCRSLGPHALVTLTLAPAATAGQAQRVLAVTGLDYWKLFKLGTRPAGAFGERLSPGECSWEDASMDSYNGVYDSGYLVDATVAEDEVEAIVLTLGSPQATPQGRLTRYPEGDQVFRLVVHPLVIRGDPSKLAVADDARPIVVQHRARPGERSLRVPDRR